MSDVFSNPFAYHDWLQTQRQYWDTWFKNLDGEDLSQTWTQALDTWWKNVAAMQTPDTQVLFKQWEEQSKQYFQFNDMLSKSFQTFNPVESFENPWLPLQNEAWDAWLKQLQNFFSQGDAMKIWQPQINNWQQGAQQFMDLAKNFIGSYPEFSPPNLDKWQAQLKQSEQLLSDYQQAQQQYAQLFMDMGMRTNALLRARVEKLLEQPASPSAMRDLYNLWVDCGEEAYAECINTKEYAEVHAQVLNSLLVWHQHSRHVLDEVLEEVTPEVAEKQGELFRQRIEALREALKTPVHHSEDIAQIDKLTKEVDSLRVAQAKLEAAYSKAEKEAKKAESSAKSATKQASDAEDKAKQIEVELQQANKALDELKASRANAEKAAEDKIAASAKALEEAEARAKTAEEKAIAAEKAAAEAASKAAATTTASNAPSIAAKPKPAGNARKTTTKRANSRRKTTTAKETAPPTGE